MRLIRTFLAGAVIVFLSESVMVQPILLQCKYTGKDEPGSSMPWGVSVDIADKVVTINGLAYAVTGINPTIVFFEFRVGDALERSGWITRMDGRMQLSIMRLGRDLDFNCQPAQPHF